MNDQRTPSVSPGQLSTEKNDPLERYSRQWQRGPAPNLDAFLAGAGKLAPAVLAALLRLDQGKRWERGERILTEDYLSKYPQLANDPEVVLDLIYGEFLLCEQRG